MTVAVRIALRARDWIREEARDLRARRPESAQAYRQAMRDAQRLLSEQPRAGVLGFIPDTRVLIMRGGYLVSYRLACERDGETVREVQIITIRHGRQQDARTPADNRMAGEPSLSR